MAQRFYNTEIGILEFNIFAHQAYRYFLIQLLDPFNHLRPFSQIGFPALKPQTFDDLPVQPFLGQH
ncbi:hypothetical protein SDC9_197986 [bioreactor metagenome]|uniref:Uncharacterized protein n=1 Tax=bioreactor metagenome TaxID=1076179 RepID=A0A645IGX3_9ZZZZ